LIYKKKFLQFAHEKEGKFKKMSNNQGHHPERGLKPKKTKGKESKNTG
jgi:hypothetical protein